MSLEQTAQRMDEQLAQANDELTQAQEAEAEKREAEQKIEAESQETGTPHRRADAGSGRCQWTEAGDR